ncbi:MAG: restriction endonuclease subunit S [bacterium]|nr:restriction endonuclease subunit S [bacterium]
MREPEYGSGERAVPVRDPNDIKYIRITDFNDDGIVPANEFATAENIEDRFLLADGDILFARSGATAGKTFIFSSEIGKSIFAGYCIRFRFDIKKVIPKFVYYYTKSNRYRAWVRSIQRPSGQPNINKEEFKSFTIPLPPTSVQLKLVREMEQEQESRRRNLEQAEVLLDGLDAFLLDCIGLAIPMLDNRLAYALKQSVLHRSKQIGADYFHPERINAIRAIQTAKKVKHAVRLEDIACFLRDYTTEYKPEQYLGLAGVQSHTGELTETTEEPGSGQASIFEENDVLFARLRPYLNKVWRAEQDGVCSTEFHVIRIRNDVNYLLPDYLAAVLRSSVVVAQTKHMMTGNTHPRLANEDVVDLLIPIPSINMQHEVVEELQNRRMQARRLREEAAKEWKAAKARFEEKLLGEEKIK